MTVKELKEAIKDLPDDMRVVTPVPRYSDPKPEMRFSRQASTWRLWVSPSSSHDYQGFDPCIAIWSDEQIKDRHKDMPQEALDRNYGHCLAIW